MGAVGLGCFLEIRRYSGGNDESVVLDVGHIVGRLQYPGRDRQRSATRRRDDRKGRNEIMHGWQVRAGWYRVTDRRLFQAGGALVNGAIGGVRPDRTGVLQFEREANSCG